MLVWVMVSVAVRVWSTVMVLSMTSVDTQTRVVGTISIDVTTWVTCMVSVIVWVTVLYWVWIWVIVVGTV